MPEPRLLLLGTRLSQPDLPDFAMCFRLLSGVLQIRVWKCVQRYMPGLFRAGGRGSVHNQRRSDRQLHTGVHRQHQVYFKRRLCGPPGACDHDGSHDQSSNHHNNSSNYTRGCSCDDTAGRGDRAGAICGSSDHPGTGVDHTGAHNSGYDQSGQSYSIHCAGE